MPQLESEVDEQALAHDLMAVLRWRHEERTRLRLVRGSSPEPIGRRGPVASGVLCDARTGRVVIAAEAVSPSGSTASVDRTVERATTLVAYVRACNADGTAAELLPAVWMHAPSAIHGALVRERPVRGAEWMAYDASGQRPPSLAVASPATTALETHDRELRALIARRDAVAGRHRDAMERARTISDRLSVSSKSFAYSAEGLRATMEDSAAASRQYLELCALLSKLVRDAR